MRLTFGVARAGALVGALAFAFGGFLSAQVGHINQISATAWLPAVVLAADLALTRASLRWAVAAAAALAIQLLAGHAQESYMTLWVVGIVLGWRVLIGTWDDVTRRPLETLDRIAMALAERRILLALGA